MKSPGRAPIGQIERISEPKYLCLADGMKTINVAEWRKAHGTSIALEYVVVSYTGQQFQANKDYSMLHAVGKHAADAAGIKTYWISDGVRGAFQIVIAVAGPIGHKIRGELPDNLLRDWGNRVWVLPELLLSPEHNDVRIYTINRSLDPGIQLRECLSAPPDQINRRNFARFWEDDKVIG
ncbi:MAG: hypothetical protein Q9179_007359 [Wetmoreana sp. 5 TL-2023]